MARRFAGFPPDALKFFRDLKKNNNREWFQERKPLYEEKVRAPMMQLIEYLGDTFGTEAPHYNFDPKKSIYRIYRDTRFSKDKTPYKTHVAASFGLSHAERHMTGGLYFHFDDKTLLVGGGVYMPSSQQLLAIRKHIAEHGAEFTKILKSRAIKGRFGEMSGETLKRAPKGFPPDHPHIDLLLYKQFLLSHSPDIGLVTTGKLQGEITKSFRAMLPFLEFLNAPFVGD